MDYSIFKGTPQGHETGRFFWRVPTTAIKNCLPAHFKLKITFQTIICPPPPPPTFRIVYYPLPRITRYLSVPPPPG